MGAHVWGWWDCPYCGQKKIRGDNRYCTNCGIQIPPATKFYIDTENIQQVDESQKNDAANWICEYCDTQNPDAADVCKNCGSPRSDAKRNYFDMQKPQAEKVAPQKKTSPEKFRISNARLKKWGIFAAVFLMILWLCVPVTRSSEITGFTWERSIDIEEFRNVDESGWTLPEGANLHRTASEIRSYRQVLDHYETKERRVAEQVLDGYDTQYVDLGNGQFDTRQIPRYRTEYRTEYYQEPVYRDEPVYDTKYYYDIDKWVTVDTLSTVGADKSPEWAVPEKSVGDYDVSAPRYGAQREGEHHENYYVIIKDKKGRDKKIEYSFEEWDDLSLGDKITYKTHRFGG